jgi:hypothetical protein
MFYSAGIHGNGKRQHRLVIYAKDIEIITGRKPAAARKMYLAIKIFFDKQPGQFITFQEFSVYTGIDESVIQEYLQG